MCSAKGYIRQIGAFAAAYLALLATLNVLVDPYRVFRLTGASPLDRYKEGASDRTTQAETARRGGVDVLLVGDSRVWIGLNANHPALTRYGSVHNCGFPACSVYEGARVIELARQTRPPRLVVWGFDPETIRGMVAKETRGGFALSRLDPGLEAWPYYRLHLFGLSSLRESLRVLERAAAHPDDSWIGRRQSVSWQPPRGDLAGLFPRILTWHVPDLEPLPAEIETGVDQLRPRLKRSQADGTRLILVFPPMHATRHEVLFRAENRRRLAEASVRELVRCVDDLNARQPQFPPIEVWDFRGFTVYHAEDLPASGAERVMRWYWEAVHMREELGAIVLTRIFGSGEAPDGFGARLTPRNVERHLAALTRQRQAYVRGHPEQLEIVTAAERIQH